MNSTPQLEDGYTRISNELLEAMLEFRLTARQWQLVMAIIRKTYGYNKREDDMSGSQLAAMCAMNRTHVSETLNQLARMNIINKRPGVYGTVISIQKDYSSWVEDVAPEKVERETVARKSGTECHYTYIIRHVLTQEFYIGVRTARCHPNQDRYKGSGNWLQTITDKALLSKEIVAVFETREDAGAAEIRLIQEHSSNPLLRNQVFYSSSIQIVSTSTESVHPVQKSESASTESVYEASTESVHTKDNLTKDNQKKVARQEVSFKKWMEQCKTDGKDPIPADDPVFSYASGVGIPLDFIRFAWVEFKRKYSAPDKSGKKYKMWARHFDNAVRENWYGIWFEKDGGFQLTTRGKMIDMEIRSKNGD